MFTVTHIYLSSFGIEVENSDINCTALRCIGTSSAQADSMVTQFLEALGNAVGVGVSCFGATLPVFFGCAHGVAMRLLSPHPRRRSNNPCDLRHALFHGVSFRRIICEDHPNVVRMHLITYLRLLKVFLMVREMGGSLAFRRPLHLQIGCMD